MVADGEFLAVPLGWVLLNGAYVEHGVAKEFLHEVESDGFALHFSSEDGHGLLLEECLAVVDEDEVAHLVHVQEHGAGIVARNGPALDDGWQRGNVVDIAWQEHPSLVLGEVAGVLVAVEEVDFLARHGLVGEHDSVFVPLLQVDGRGGCEAVVVVDAREDVVVVVALGCLFEKCGQAVAQEGLGRGEAKVVAGVVVYFGVLAAMEGVVEIHCQD